MTNTRVVLLTGTAALAGAWLSSAAGTVSVSAPVVLNGGSPPAQSVTPAPTQREFDLEREVARLSARLEQAPQPRYPVRNPFTLSRRQTEERAAELSTMTAPPVTEALAVANVPVEPAAPTVTLSGIGTEPTPTGVEHTAVLSVDGQVLLATTGDELLGRFQVRAVTADRAELFDLDEATTLHLTLP